MDFNKALKERIGEELYDKFRKARVAVCGLGGLGSSAAIALARSGIGSLRLIDFDKIDASNLNRQQYKATQIGLYKTEALKQNILEAAPSCNVIASTIRLDKSSIPEIISDCGIICECFDIPENKAMLIDTVSEHFPEKYIVAASGMSGLHSANSIVTKKLGKRLYICGDGESDVKNDKTLFASRVMLCAAHQANTVLRIIAGNFDI